MNGSTDIKVVTQLEAIRSRPGMYVDNSEDGSGLANMVFAVLDLSLDEHFAGHCSRIAIELLADGSAVVDDDGRGLSLDESGGITYAEKLLTSLIMRPTRDGRPQGNPWDRTAYGLLQVSALSSWTQLDIYQGLVCHSQQYKRGVAVSPMVRAESQKRNGTRIAFMPDAEIFPNTWIDPSRIVNRLKELSYLLPNLTLAFKDHRQHEFNEKQGISACAWNDAWWPEKYTNTTFHVAAEYEGTRVDVAAAWGTTGKSIKSFAQYDRTVDGGTHVEGLILGLVNGLKAAIPLVCTARSDSELVDLVGLGLSAVVSVHVNEPRYAGSTRDRLLSPAARDAVMASVGSPFTKYLLSEPTLLKRFSDSLALPRLSDIN